MANDGTVKIGTELDQSGFKSGLSGLGSFASKGFGAIGSAAGVMASVTVGALAAVATGMGAAVASGVKYNAQMENYTANFTTMLGSEEAAVAKVNELKKLGASTPFEMSDLATATTTLLAFGVSADDSTDILTMLGDVSLGNAEKLGSLTNAFGKANSMGKLTGETCQMMIEAGFNPLKVISEQTGESMAELQDRMSKGGISADELTAAFKTATSEGGQFYKGMETASTTFDGLISTLKDNANSLVGEVVKPISDSMTKTLLPEAIGMIGTLTDAFEKDGIPGLIDAAGGVVGQIITGIAKEAPQVIQMASGFLTTLLNAIITQLPALATAGLGIMTELVNAITANLPMLVTIVLSIVTTLATGLLAQLPALVSCGLDILVSLIQGITDALPQLITMLPTIIQDIVSTLLEHLPEIIQCAIQLLVTLVQGITSALPQLIAMLPTIISTIIDTLLANLGLIIQCAIQLLVALIQGLSEAIPQLIDMLPEIITTIVDVLIDNLPLILQAGWDILMALSQGLIKALPDLIMMIPDICAGIKDSLAKFDWGKLGKNMIDGIKNGVVQSAGNLVAAAKEAAERAIQGVKDWLGIHSPSKRFEKEVGKQIPAGAAKGVDDNAYLLEDASTDSARNAIKAAQGISASGMLSQMQGQAYVRTQAVTGASAAVTAVTGGSTGSFDYDAMAAANAKALDGMTVEADGETIGHVVTKYVDQNLGDADKNAERGA